MAHTIPCNNPAHGVQNHIAGTAAATECQSSSGSGGMVGQRVEMIPAVTPSPRQSDDTQELIEQHFYGNEGLLPVRVDDGQNTWLIQEAEYPFYNAGITYEEAVSEDLKLHGVEVKLERAGKPSIGGETLVSIRGPFASVKSWLAQYIGETYVADLTPEQIETGRDALEEARAEERRQERYDS